jgi:hypothetical protein
MADRLKGKVAIVTGAGSRNEGIGNGRSAAMIIRFVGERPAFTGVGAGV